MNSRAWRGCRVLVTGAGGFIGSHLAEELVARGAEVTALVHYNSRNSWGMLDEHRKGLDGLFPVLGDVSDGRMMQSLCREKDVVFHLAALIGIPYSYQAPESYVTTNVLGTLHVMQACLDAGVGRIVHTSTSEVYGTAQYTPMDEKHPIVGQSPYSASKIGADKIAESFHRSFGLPVVTLRPFNTYGPRQSARAVIPAIITQALASDTVRLGSLDPVRDFTYVKDTVKGFIKAAESDAAIGMTINTGTGRGVTIGDIAELILKHANPTAQIVADAARVRPTDSEVRQLVCNNALAERVLSWRPTVALEEGIVNTIPWVREHLDDYKSSNYAV